MSSILTAQQILLVNKKTLTFYWVLDEVSRIFHQIKGDTMNYRISSRTLKAALTFIAGASSAHAQQQTIEKNLKVTVGVPTTKVDENSQVAEDLQKILNKSGHTDYAIELDPSGLIAKVIVKEDPKNQSLNSLIKKLNSQMKKKVVIIEVEPAKITNGTQDDL